MGSILRKIVNTLPASYDKAKFNRNDLFAVMQGMTGFTKAVAGKNPLDFVDAAIGVTAALAHKGCLKSLDAYLNDVKTWLTFGDKYKPLEDSSDLDFDQVNVSSVPDIMQVRCIVTCAREHKQVIIRSFFREDHSRSRRMIGCYLSIH